jgi:hypothetical protein
MCVKGANGEEVHALIFAKYLTLIEPDICHAILRKGHINTQDVLF